MSTRRVLLVVATAVVVGMVTVLGLWEAYWPTNVDRRELNRVGPPVAGAVRAGSDHVSEGTAVCIDVCIHLARSYRLPPGTELHAALDGARDVLSRQGYAGQPGGFACTVTSTQPAEFECDVGGHRPGFDAYVYFVGHTATGIPGIPQEGLEFDVPAVPVPVRTARVEVAHE